MEKIAIVTSGHPPFDERIFYKLAKSFVKKGFSVSIICSTYPSNLIKDDITIIGFTGEKLTKREKISKLTFELEQTQPDLIICCEPLTILAAKRFTRSLQKKINICYDITEWYPENVASKIKGLKKIFSYLILFLFNIYVSNLTDILIFGEKLKRRRYEFIAPGKKIIMIEYYPVLEYFRFIPKINDGKSITLAYTGLITVERGILNVINAIKLLAERNPELNITFKIIGKFLTETEEKIVKDELDSLKQIQVILQNWVDYNDLSMQLSEVDICLELREKTFIFNNSLPIKLFDFLASGKTIIYSDIKAIKNEIDISEFGFLVDPKDYPSIAAIIENYISHPDILKKHSEKARKAAEQKYNWESVENKLLKLIKE